MDWTKQTEEMFKTWTGAQQRMLDSWINTVQTLKPSQASETWQKSIDAWRTEVHKALEAQLKWTQLWADGFKSTLGGTTQAEDMSKQLVDLMRRWTEAQGQFWERWFDLARQTEGLAVINPVNAEEAQKVLRSWQEASQKAIDTQLEWARIFTGQKNNPS